MMVGIRLIHAIFGAALICGCGGLPGDQPTASRTVALAADLQTASVQMVSGDLPGCDQVTVAGALTMLRYPGAIDLVVVVVDGHAACVDTKEVAEQLIVRSAAAAQPHHSAAPASTQTSTEPEGETQPADDPVPVRGAQDDRDSGRKQQETTPGDVIGDDPVPVISGRESQVHLATSN